MAPEGELKFQSVLEEPEVQIPWAQRMLKHARNHPLGSFGAGIVIAMTFLAIFAESLTVYDPVLNDFEVMLTAPGDKFFFGTDQFGRDVLTRIIYGSRTALFVGLTAAFFGSVIGLVLGVASAYFGGRFDLLLQRVMDVFMAFPLIIMALAIVSTLDTRPRHRKRDHRHHHTVYPAMCAGGAVQRPGHSRDPLCGCRPGFGIFPFKDYPSSHGSQRDSTVFDYGQHLRWPCDLVGSVVELFRAWRSGTDTGLGLDVAGRSRGIRRKCTMDGDLARRCYQPCGVWVQPVRRCPSRYPRSQTALPVRATH